MKHLKIINQIFLKEIKEGLRDPKTILFTYLLPLVIYPLFFIWIAELAAIQVESVRSEKLSVLFSGVVPNELGDLIKKEKNIVVTESNASIDSQIATLKPNEVAGSNLRKTLQNEKVSAVFRCESFSVHGSADADVRCSIYYDQSNERSSRVKSQLTKASESYQKEAREHRLKTLKLSEELITPFALTANDTAGIVRSTNKTVGNVIPLFLIMILYLSSFYPALNSTVGERERGTYATLLTLPIDPFHLVSGKFLSVLFFCFAGLSSYMVPPWIGSFFVPQAAYDKMQSLHFVFPNSLALLPIILISAAALLSAISICVGFFARKMSEAQGYYSILMLAMMFPVILSDASNISLNALTALVPLFNFVLILKSFVVDPIATNLIVEVAIVNFVAAIFFLGLASYSIRAEYRYDTVLSDLLSFKRSMVRYLTPSLSMMLFVIILGTVLYINVALAKAPVIVTIGLSHFLVLIGLPFAAVRYYRLSVRDSFKLKLPTFKSIGAAILAGVSCLFVVATFLPKFPLPKEMTDQWMNALVPQGGSISLALITVAFVPALAEELAFRGVILGGLQRGFPKGWAILISSVMFAAVHMSATRFLPTFCIGLILGYAAIQTRSIVPGMIIHALNNGIAVILMKYGSSLSFGGEKEVDPPLLFGFIALGVLGAAVAILYREGLASKVIPPTQGLERPKIAA